MIVKLVGAVTLLSKLVCMGIGYVRGVLFQYHINFVFGEGLNCFHAESMINFTIMKESNALWTSSQAGCCGIVHELVQYLKCSMQ